jgi:glucosamine-6-phosphate deaminase
LGLKKEILVDRLKVKVYDTKKTMGEAAAKETILRIKELLTYKPQINMVFAAAPSQNEFLHMLASSCDVEWEKINAFHLDEYIGLDYNATQRFGNFLKTRIFDKVPFRTINYLDGNNPDIQAECDRYTELIKQYPIDIACIGIGENGHIAFNDPHVADFKDQAVVKAVELDEKCRLQQVNDKCFNSIQEVPKRALTLTIPAIYSAQYIYCIVPGALKAQAVKNTIYGPINESCPASILRQHKNVVLYLDEDSSKLIL